MILTLILLLLTSPLIAAPYDVPNKDEEWINKRWNIIDVGRKGTTLYWWHKVEVCDLWDDGIIRTLWRKIYYEVEWMGIYLSSHTLDERGMLKCLERPLLVPFCPRTPCKEMGNRKDGMLVWREVE